MKRDGSLQFLALIEAGMTHSNVEKMLREAIRSAHPDQWAAYHDHDGDGTTGNVQYLREDKSNGWGGDAKMYQCPYEVQEMGDSTACNVRTAEAKRVTPIVSYATIPDDDDYYTSMQESMVRAKLYAELPVYERYISKDERDKADASSFAGKNKSFPILKPEDVMAAVRSIGRAGSDNHSANTLKANIIRIAKSKGWTNELPKAWRGDEAKESKPVAQQQTSPITLSESSESIGFLAELNLRESETRSTYPVLMITPGTGSSAHYPADVLERAAKEGKFPKGTLMFWNHQTSREAAERPEGDLNDMAAITTKDGYWDPKGPKGAGIYSEAKPMADYAEKIASRAPHIGLSIRAGGTGTGKTVDGKPVLQSIDYVESVDYVTRAGRGGMALAEAARDAGILQGEDDMELKEAQRLIDEGIKRATLPILIGEAKRGAKEEATLILEGITLPEAAKRQIINRSVERLGEAGCAAMKDGVLVVEEFRKIVVAEAKAEGKYLAELTGGGRVIGMGASDPFAAPVEETPESILAQEAKEKRERKAHRKLLEGKVHVFSRLTGGNDNAARAAAIRRSA